MSETSPGAVITDRDAATNGITLRCATWGTFTSPARTVLLVHGITFNSRSFATVGPALATQGWYVVAPDLRGRGFSAKPPHGYGIPYHVNDLLALGDALGLPTLNLVGHSLGAQIVLMLAAIHPGRVGKLVLVDGGGKTPADALETVAASVKRIGQVYPSLDAFLEERRQAPVYQWNAYWEQLFRYDVEVRPDGTAASRMPKHALDEEIAVNYFLRSEALPDFVRAPTLIVRAAVGTLGADRGFILPAEEAERMRSAIPDCRIVVIPDTNHYTVVLPDAFNQELLAFLGG